MTSTTTTTSTASTTPVPAPVTTQAALIAAIQATITAAQAESSAVGATQAQQLAALQLVAQLQAILLQEQLQSQPSATTYEVSGADLAAGGIFGIAQRAFGDPLRFVDIQTLNGMAGIALYAGQVLTLPAS